MAAGDWKEMLYACQQGELERLKYQLDEGVNPNYQDPEFLTSSLITSIEYGHIELTALLLLKGGDPLLRVGFSSDTPMNLPNELINGQLLLF